MVQGQDSPSIVQDTELFVKAKEGDSTGRVGLEVVDGVTTNSKGLLDLAVWIGAILVDSIAFGFGQTLLVVARGTLPKGRSTSLAGW